ncbi:unnamed protein product [Sympodiomycopsis kandeliae]
MNNIRSIAALNEHELKLALDGSTRGSWHDEYKESAVIFVGGLDTGLTEGDVITIFSQFGEILDINLPKWTSSGIAAQQRRNAATSGDPNTRRPDYEKERRDAEEAKKKVGKRRGFGFLLYQDQRSTVLAVDNLNGAQVLGKTLRVDHVKDYKQLEKDSESGKMREADERTMNARPQLIGGSADPSSSRNGPSGGATDDSPDEQDDLDLEDPMAAYIAEERRKEGRGKGELSHSRHHRSSQDDDLDSEDPMASYIASSSRRDRDRRYSERSRRRSRDRSPRHSRGAGINDSSMDAYINSGRGYESSGREDPSSRSVRRPSKRRDGSDHDDPMASYLQDGRQDSDNGRDDRHRRPKDRWSERQEARALHEPMGMHSEGRRRKHDERRGDRERTKDRWSERREDGEDRWKESNSRHS